MVIIIDDVNLNSFPEHQQTQIVKYMRSLIAHRTEAKSSMRIAKTRILSCTNESIHTGSQTNEIVRLGVPIYLRPLST